MTTIYPRPVCGPTNAAMSQREKQKSCWTLTPSLLPPHSSSLQLRGPEFLKILQRLIPPAALVESSQHHHCELTFVRKSQNVLFVDTGNEFQCSISQVFMDPFFRVHCMQYKFEHDYAKSKDDTSVYGGMCLWLDGIT